MDKEIQNLHRNNTWKLIPQTPGMHIMKTMFIFKLKVQADGSIKQYKAHFIAKGFTQTWNINYHKTFTPIISIKNFQLLLAFTVAYNLKIHQMDVKAAFLHTPLTKVVYMTQPKGYINPERPNYFCQLYKSLYRLKQAPYKWNHTINRHLLANSFKPLNTNACIYMLQSHGCITIITLYIYDCTILTHHQLLQSTKDILLSKFKIKDLGKAQSILGMEILHNQPTRQLQLQMSSYSNETLTCFSMSNSQPSPTPMTPGLTLPHLDQTPSDTLSLPYQNTVRKLLYLTHIGRPDMLYTVHYLSHFMNRFNTRHWKAVKHVLQYLHGTVNHSILYNQHFSSPQEPRSLIPLISCDANFSPSNINNQKSLSAIKVQLCRGTIAWFIKTQDCVTLSTMESELNTISVAVCHALYLQKLLHPLRIPTSKPWISIMNNNQSAITLITARRSSYIRNQKHYNIKVKHAHDTIKTGHVLLNYCPTTKLPANLLTKPLTQIQFNKLKTKLRLHSHNNQD